MQKVSPARAAEVTEIRPIVVVSQCLGFEAVRYDGKMLQDAFVKALADHVKVIQVCPEVGIGLGVPRDPIQIVVEADGRRLVQPSTGRDLTQAMRTFADGFLAGLGPVDGFILKSRSPSCGLKDVKLFNARDGLPAGKGAGFFAEAVRQRFPAAAIEDEDRLANGRLRHQFLTRIFLSARFRQVQTRPTMAELVRFHDQSKFQLMAYSSAGLTELSRIIANIYSDPVEKVFREYAEALAQVTAESIRPSANRSVLVQGFGCLSQRLTPEERRHFLDRVEDYRVGRLPLSPLLTLMQSWIARVEEPSLAAERFFDPYPRSLLDLVDSVPEKRE